MQYEARLVNNKCQLKIDASKPNDLKSLVISWTWKIQAGSTWKESNQFTVDSSNGIDHVNGFSNRRGTTEDSDCVAGTYANALTNGTIGELLLTTKQLTSRKANIVAIIPYYMIRKIRVNINGQEIGEIPPENIFEICLIRLTFTSVLYNTLDRPCPNSLSTPRRFLPYTGLQAHDSSNANTTQDTFFFDNILVFKSLLVDPLTRTSRWTNVPYHFQLFHWVNTWKNTLEFLLNG